jgi:hypothetical protein
MRNTIKLLGFVTLIALVGFLFAACPDGNGVGDEKDEWPDTTGYRYLSREFSLSDAKDKMKIVSPGDKFYSNGIFNSEFGNSTYCSAITVEQNCAITIDFQKFKFGYLRLTLNDKNISSSGIIYITPGDILVFELNPGGKFSMGSNRDWMFGFSVAEDTYNTYYIVHYNANGGTGTVPSDRTVKEGSAINVSGQETLTYTGKIFGGWNTEADGSGTSYAADASLTVNEDITLYAQWVYQYTVSYDANGGTGSVPTAQTVNDGSAITISYWGLLSFPGKSFGYWNTESDGSGMPYINGDSLTVNENITLYAQWVDRYTVTYHANGGTGTVPTTQTVNNGTTITASGRGSLNYTGNNFNGWNTETDGSGTSYAVSASLTVNEDITLYAQWTVIQYTITYHANNGTGTVPEPQTVDWGDSIILSNGDTLTRNRYHFGGWNTSSLGTGTNYQVGSSFTPSNNITLYARWIAPRIRTEDAYKEVTDGVVRISLSSDAQYIFNGTESYRLYRSTTQFGTYTLVATVLSNQLVLEDTTADWMTTGSSYFYKVAAVSGGIEAMSTNGVRINNVAPRVFVQYSQYASFGNYGYCGVQLENGSGGYAEWGASTTSTAPSYELVLSPDESPPPPDNYTLYTRTYSFTSWNDRGPLIIRASHTYMITAYLGTEPESSFVKTNWTFFTPL